MMALDGKLPFRTALNVGIALMTMSPMAAASSGLYQQYCSSENTGSDYGAVKNIYQSMGSCSKQCTGEGYAFAVVQYQDCWCSNYIPSSQDNTGDCSEKCPGYPSDLCGNSGQGLFGYIPLNAQPSGTAGAGGSSSQQSSTPQPESTSQPPTSSQPPTTSQPLETSSQPPETSSQPPPPPSSSSPPETSYVPSSTSSIPAYTSSSAAPTTTSHSRHHPTPVTTVEVVTESGSVVTQTVTSTPMVVQGSGDSQEQTISRTGLSGGAIAGVIIGVLIGVAAVVLGAFLLWRRKKRNDADDDDEIGSSGGAKPKRNTSVLSRTGLLGGRQSMSENTYDDNRNSMMFGAGATVEGVSPSSPLGGSQDNISNRRYSRPMVYDQRLNPSALFANPEANGSRVSMQDTQDYSRPLGIANPDVRASFDSR